MTSETRKGERLLSYELLSEVARSATYHTYLAKDHRNGRLVEVRLLAQAASHEGKAAQTLVRSANVVREIRHPALAQVLALEADGEGLPFVVEEHCEGVSIGARLRDSRRGFPPTLAIHWLAPVAEAVARCHDLGLVHGCIERDHVVFVETALGPSAKLMRFGDRAGAPLDRLAPELRVEGAIADARSDVWGLAALLWEVLSSEPPAADVRPEALTRSVMGLPEALVALLVSCLAADPKARPGDASALSELLRRTRDQAAPVTDNGLLVAVRAKLLPAQATAPTVACVPAPVVRAQAQAHLRPNALPEHERAMPAPIAGQPEVRGAKTLLDNLPAAGLPATGARRTHLEFPASRRLRRRRRSSARNKDLVASVEQALKAAASAAAEAAAMAPEKAGVAATPGAAEPSAVAAPDYQLPSQTFLDIKPKNAEAGSAAPPSVQDEAAAPPNQAQPQHARKAEVGIPALLSAHSDTTGAGGPEPQAPSLAPVEARPRGAARSALRARSVRVRGRSLSIKVRAKARGAADGPRPVHADAVAARGKTAASGAEVAGRAPIAAAGGLPRTREMRPALGRGYGAATDAIRRAGEEEGQRQLRAELAVLGFCTILLFGVPMLCDPAHARAEAFFGDFARAGVALIAGSAVIALLQLWWLQMSTQQTALWPAANALKLVTLLVCILSAAHFMQAGTIGSVEALARSILPWAAGVFYLALGLYGLSKTRYNTEQSLTLGRVLAFLYGASLLGSFHVIRASRSFDHEVEVAEAGNARALAGSLESLRHAPQPGEMLGSTEGNATEAELERLGDTSARDLPDGPTGTGRESELRDEERLKGSRRDRAAQLEELNQRLKALHQ